MATVPVSNTDVTAFSVIRMTKTLLIKNTTVYGVHVASTQCEVVLGTVIIQLTKKYRYCTEPYKQ